MALGFVGAGGAKGASDALREIIADRLREEATQRMIAQQEFENAMATRQADTGDRRFDRTQGFTERMGDANLDLSRRGVDLDERGFEHRVNQDVRGNTIEDAALARDAEDRAGKISFLDEVAGQQTDPLRRNTVRGLRYNVQLPDLRTAQQRGADTGAEELSAFQSGGRQVRQGETDIIVGGNIRSTNAAAANRAPAGPDPDAADAEMKAAEVKRIATALLNHAGLDSAFGVGNSRFPTVRQDTADAETLLASLRGLLTVENMKLMKGVLSDKDMEIVLAASTTLNQKMSAKAAREELQRLGGILQKYDMAGVPGGVDVGPVGGIVLTPPPDNSGTWRHDGKTWVKR